MSARKKKVETKKQTTEDVVIYPEFLRLNSDLILVDPSLENIRNGEAEQYKNYLVVPAPVQELVNLFSKVPRILKEKPARDDMLYWGGMAIRWNIFFSLMSFSISQEKFNEIIDKAIISKLIETQKRLNDAKIVPKPEVQTGPPRKQTRTPKRQNKPAERGEKKVQSEKEIDPTSFHKFSDGVFLITKLDEKQIRKYVPTEKPQKDNKILNLCDEMMIGRDYTYDKAREYADGMEKDYGTSQTLSAVIIDEKLSYVEHSKFKIGNAEKSVDITYTNLEKSNLMSKVSDSTPKKQPHPDEYIFYAIENAQKNGSRDDVSPVAIAMWKLFDESTMYGKYALLDIWCLDNDTRIFSKRTGIKGGYGGLVLQRSIIDIYQRGYTKAILEVLTGPTDGVEEDVKQLMKDTMSTYTRMGFVPIQNMTRKETIIERGYDPRIEERIFSVMSLDINSKFIRYTSLQTIFNGEDPEGILQYS
jgi:hypothetical protein